MATVRNPTKYSIFCHQLGRSLSPRESVEVDDDVAAKVPTVIFEVTGLPDPADDEDESEDESQAARAAGRKTVSRGTKPVEVTEGHAAEER